MQYERKPGGRPREFAEEEIDKMAKKLEAMILAASQGYRVTAQKFDKGNPIKRSDKVVSESTPHHGHIWHPYSREA